MIGLIVAAALIAWMIAGVAFVIISMNELHKWKRGQR